MAEGFSRPIREAGLTSRRHDPWILLPVLPAELSLALWLSVKGSDGSIAPLRPRYEPLHHLIQPASRRPQPVTGVGRVTVVPVAAAVRTASIVAAWLTASARPKADGVPVAIARDAVSNSMR